VTIPPPVLSRRRVPLSQRAVERDVRRRDVTRAVAPGLVRLAFMPIGATSRWREARSSFPRDGRRRSPAVIT